MTAEEVTSLIKQAWKKLILDQPDFGHFTPQTTQRELNIAHHFARYLDELLSTRVDWPISHDFDIWKREQRKRPDIIFHQRGTHDNNLLVIELKVDGNKQDQLNELRRIKEVWFNEFDYKFGAYLNVARTGTDSLDLIVLKNNA
jgi:hypothetical protein